jgi:hypothetical protein
VRRLAVCLWNAVLAARSVIGRQDRCAGCLSDRRLYISSCLSFGEVQLETFEIWILSSILSINTIPNLRDAGPSLSNTLSLPTRTYWRWSLWGKPRVGTWSDTGVSAQLHSWCDSPGSHRRALDPCRGVERHPCHAGR